MKYNLDYERLDYKILERALVETFNIIDNEEHDKEEETETLLQIEAYMGELIYRIGERTGNKRTTLEGGSQSISIPDGEPGYLVDDIMSAMEAIRLTIEVQEQ